MSLNGAKVLGVADKLGSVAVGKRADLVVLRGDLGATPGFSLRSAAIGGADR